MFVLTIDQKNSRDNRDRVPDALELLSQFPTIAPFERTIGDEFQGVLASAADVYDTTMCLIRDGHWHCGIGVGKGYFPQPEHPRTFEGRGDAFLAAREAVEAGKNLSPSVLLCAPVEQEKILPVRALMRLAASIVSTRSARQWQVIDAMRAFPTMSAAARNLGMSVSAVSQSLMLSRFALEKEAREATIMLLSELEANLMKESD